jgi:hypothetical protein
LEKSTASSDTKGNMVMGIIAIKALLKHCDGLNGKIKFELTGCVKPHP